jgi:hypothetical protein
LYFQLLPAISQLFPPFQQCVEIRIEAATDRQSIEISIEFVCLISHFSLFIGIGGIGAFSGGGGVGRTSPP